MISSISACRTHKTLWFGSVMTRAGEAARRGTTRGRHSTLRGVESSQWHAIMCVALLPEIQPF